MPRFHIRELMDKLERGQCETANPFNPAQKRQISLNPGDIDGIVFWTRYCENPEILTRFLIEKDIPYYFLYTITNYPSWLETNAPDLNKTLENFIRLSEISGRDRTVWRYDPILLTENLSYQYHLGNFNKLCDRLKDFTDTVIVSLYDEYGCSERNLSRIRSQLGPNLPLPSAKFSSFLEEIRQISEAHGIKIQCCCEPRIADHSSIKPGACVSLSRLLSGGGDFNKLKSPKKDPGQRKNCLCDKSADIGAYNSCAGGCLYCYANKKSIKL